MLFFVDISTSVEMDLNLGVVCLCWILLLSSVSTAMVESVESNNLGRGLDAKGVLTTLASNLMTRGYGSSGVGSSQIVSFNLTNLLVLVLLKALIFAAGSIGAGHFKGGYARSADGDEKFITDEEILMFLSYLTGSPGCLQNIACQQPEQAKKYVAAGDMVLRLSRLFSLDTNIDYDNILQEIEQASNIGLTGGSCSKFECITKQ